MCDTMMRISVGFFLLLVVYEAGARKNGAPLSACVSMTPSHGSTPRTDTPMFVLSVSTSVYKPGSAATVTLQSLSSSTFKGFFIQVRTTNPSKDVTHRYGQFSAGVDSRTSCSGSAITHVINSVKTEVSFLWTAPTTDEGELQFWVTYVQQFSSYWVAVKSAIVKPVQSTIATKPPTASTTSSKLPTTDSSAGNVSTTDNSLTKASTTTPAVRDKPGAGTNRDKPALFMFIALLSVLLELCR